MSKSAFSWAIAQDIPPAEKLMLSVIAHEIDPETNTCSLTMSRLTEIMGYREITSTYAVRRRIIARGLLKKTTRRDGVAGGRSNQWRTHYSVAYRAGGANGI